MRGWGGGGGGGGGGLNRAREVNKFIASKMGVIREGGLVKEKRAGGEVTTGFTVELKGLCQDEVQSIITFMPDTRYET